MKLITRDTDYAVRALCFIAESKKKVVSAAELIKELRMPRPFLRKLLQILNKHGILESYKGLGGGFALNLPADKIYLLDLVEIFQGPLKLNECLFKKRLCPNRSICRLRRKIEGIQRNVFLELKTVNIAGLLK